MQAKISDGGDFSEVNNSYAWLLFLWRDELPKNCIDILSI